jgi:hypothetical protein
VPSLRRLLEKKDAPERQGARLQELLDDLESADPGARAAAVREFCPCRSVWDVPVIRYVAGALEDPDRGVRNAAEHVLGDDSRWGKKLDHRRAHREVLEGSADEGQPGPRSLAWRQSRRPRAKGAARMRLQPRSRGGLPR